MVKFGEIVKVTEARKPKNGVVHLKYKNGALIKKIIEILEERPGVTSKQLSKIIYPGDPKGEARLATWLWSRVKSDHAPFIRRKLDGLWHYYPSNYMIPGKVKEKPKGTIQSGVLSESLAQALFNYYAANKEPNLQGFIKYLKDLES